MDGTLLNENHEVSDYTKSMIVRAQNKGIQVILSTGRPIEFSYNLHLELGVTSDLVTTNGAQMWSADKQLLKEYTFESYIAEDLWHYGNLNDYYMWMVATNELFRYSSRPENFRSEEHTSELQSRGHLVCRLLLA